MIYNRKAVAMVELIFSIVIMGIVMMSAPMLIAQASKGSFVAIQQEAISAAATDLAMILTRHWDEGDTNVSLESTILITQGNRLLNEANLSSVSVGRRAGSSRYTPRTFVNSRGKRLNATTKANFVDGNLDDIDDYDNNTHYLTVVNTSTQGDYLDLNLTFKTVVTYISDTPTLGNYKSKDLGLSNPFNTLSTTSTSNIKMITINVTTSSKVKELDKNIRLRAFSCNIGTYRLESRTF